MDKIYQWIDATWGWISRLLFVRFQFDLKPDQLREKKLDGKLVFALVHGDLIDWLVLSSWCRTQGFGAILVANRKRVLFFSKPLYFFQVLLGRRTYADLFLNEEPGPRLFFCPSHERNRLYDPTSGEKMLADIYARTVGKNGKPPFDIVPIFIQWRKTIRGSQRDLSEYFFGLSSNPNFIGKLWYLLRKRNDSTVRALDPVNFSAKDSSESADHLGDTEAQRAAKNIRRKVLVSTFQEMRVVLGPRFQSPHSVKETLMKDPEVQRAIEDIAASEGIDKRKVMMRAYQYFTEIAANYTYRFIEVSYVVLTWIFTRVFDGMNAKDTDLQMVRDTMKTKPVVFISCHRSHLDYLVVPYVLFLKDMVTPLVAAGINLAFWPVGPFLRMGGAFIIRRSFRGNPLYSLCLRKYIEYVLKNRFTINFFIEGTRSRTGKMLPPAYGLLKMTLECVQNNVLDDIALIPISICYDEVPEEKSYSKELSGGEKERESTKSLIESRKILKRNFGKVYVRFSRPLYAKSVYESSEVTGIDPTLMLQKTAFQLCKNINDVTPVTPKSIVSSILLAYRLDSVAPQDLARISEKMAAYAEYSGHELSIPRGPSFTHAIEQTIKRLHKGGAIYFSDAGASEYVTDAKRRIGLNFYKNNAIHCFMIPSIAMLAVFRTFSLYKEATDGDFYDRMVRNAVSIRNLLKFEFFFSPTPVFANEIKATFDFFMGHASWESKSALDWVEGLHRYFPDWEDATVYLGLMGDLLESYRAAADCLRELSGTKIEKKMLLAKMAKYGVSREEADQITFPESISTQNYSNALLLFENLGFLSTHKDGIGTQVEIGEWNDEMDRFSLQVDDYLDLIAQNPTEVASRVTTQP